ncbi:MAG: hypothetical protein ACO1N0_20460 [Fluviicola sp.]
MSKQYLSFFAFLVLSIGITFSQRDSTGYKNQIKFSPVRLLDPINPGIELSYERAFNRFSSQISGAYLTPILPNLSFDQFKGVRFVFEEKFFFAPGYKGMFRAQRYFKPYVAAQFLVNSTSYRNEGYFRDSTLQSTDSLFYKGYLDEYGVKKMAYAFTLKYGFQMQIRHFVLDLGFGIGIRYRDIVHSDRLIPQDVPVTSRHPNIYDWGNREGKIWSANLAVHVKLGYRF